MLRVACSAVRVARRGSPVRCCGIRVACYGLRVMGCFDTMRHALCPLASIPRRLSSILSLCPLTPRMKIHPIHGYFRLKFMPDGSGF
jgi:hypothetical protein